MLDIKFIKENKDLVARAIKDKKSEKVDLDRLLALHEDRTRMRGELDGLNAERNKAAEERDIEKGKNLKQRAQTLEDKLKDVEKSFVELMLLIPNVPSPDTPIGDESKNKMVKEWGEKPNFGFQPKDHVALMEALDIADFERGTKVHGFRGYFLKGDGVALSFAIWNYARDFFGEKEFTQIIAPALVRRENFYGTGHLPNGAEDLFETQDKDYLSGTAEVPVMGYYRDEVLDLKQLPVKFLAFSPCYRREAGSYGKDTKGLIRVHEFYKWEQVILCEANHEESVKWHEEMNRNTEAFIESLGIPYRTVINATGDLGLGQVKKYDIELWVPLEETYREISSASYFHDFQTRRFNIKYKDKDGKNRYMHSLNSTAIPTPRILVSLVENFQQEDGTIQIPEVLQKYMGKGTIIPR